MESTIKTNAKMVADQLKKSPVLSRFIAKKKLKIVEGYYNFHTGKVELL